MKQIDLGIVLKQCSFDHPYFQAYLVSQTIIFFLIVVLGISC